MYPAESVSQVLCARITLRSAAVGKYSTPVKPARVRKSDAIPVDASRIRRRRAKQILSCNHVESLAKRHPSFGPRIFRSVNRRPFPNAAWVAARLKPETG